MEQEQNTQIISTEQAVIKQDKPKVASEYFLPASILISTVILAAAWVYTESLRAKQASFQNATEKLAVQSSQNSGSVKPAVSENQLEEKVLPSSGVVLPVRWGDLGKQMTESGVIDRKKFEAIYAQRGGLNEEAKKLLYGTDNGYIKITEENSGLVLNLLWALGLGNKNEILEKGPMTDIKYSGAGNFASTGGWSLASGKAMDHYSKHSFIALTPEQQATVARVSQNIYRPCCGNSTYFPDCNHGMAMLGLLELMASQGVSEAEMYKAALKVNSYWFPDTYLTIAKYLSSKGIFWEQADAKGVLSSEFSSAGGYRQVRSQVEPVQQQGGGGCGI